MAKSATMSKRGKPGDRAATAAGDSARLAQPDAAKIYRARVEWHRHGIALLPEGGDRRPGVVYYTEKSAFSTRHRFCTCSFSKRKTCPHLLTFRNFYSQMGGRQWLERQQAEFKQSVWYALARVLAEGQSEPPQGFRMHMLKRVAPSEGGEFSTFPVIQVLGGDGEERLTYLSQGADQVRFLERCSMPSVDISRDGVFKRLALLTLTDAERLMADRGFKTRGQVFESSFWYRVAYHGFREWGPAECTLRPEIEERSGRFSITFEDGSGHTVLRIGLPRHKVRRTLDVLRQALPNQHHMPIHPLPLKSIFKVDLNTELDLELRPMIQLLQEDGEERFFQRQDLERFRYGDLIYVPELGILAELEPPGQMQRRFSSPKKMVLKKSQVPTFLEAYGEELRDGHLLTPSVERLKIFTDFDRLEISPRSLDRDWCWLSASYGFGNQRVSLVELLQAKKDAQRFIATAEGWVDCQAPAFEALDHVLETLDQGPIGEKDHDVRLSKLDLLRLGSAAHDRLAVSGKSRRAALLKRIMELRPARPAPPLRGMTSALRKYQARGVAWIRFLFENGLGGLLCDDMGLGKTHQVMAFLLGLVESGECRGPFLVVCPTTVLSHWERKIREHIPALRASVYHGGGRDLEEAMRDACILLTSYGVLRMDVATLEKVRFSVAVFDEIQYLKNPATLSYGAARRIQAGMKLGLTGTPIENNLGDLQALMDLTVPGYLGDHETFDRRYRHPIEEGGERGPRDALSRLITPFVLRRLKKSVLQELPQKIEDIRPCRLSDDQVALYREAVGSRGRGLLEQLTQPQTPVPYIHIFALLNLLKQICDHPALVEGNPLDYEKYRSGKWDLFQELLAECLDSGQKVVVYSQYLGMIKIIEHHLGQRGIDHVVLTGATRARGEVIARFNDDPNCRVYVGSLRAGGTGIDLVAASVVIHYDRWWNAAREDQATDRVHRIGQRRGVQVFKLVTEGTLEEKISAIIERKRKLMKSVVVEDDPATMKVFTREELMALLGDPEAT